MSWAIELDAADAPACGPLRDEPGIEACIVGERMWLRGEFLDDALAGRLRKLPARGRYRAGTDGALVAEGARVPQGCLPGGTWLALRSWLPVEPPPVRSCGGAARIDRVGLKLVRHGAPRRANLLEVPFGVWRAHAEVAPAIRLARWSFAVGDGGATLVRGAPLPALHGRRLVEEGSVAVSAGLMWFPSVSPAVIRALVGAVGDDLVVLSATPDSKALRCTVVPGDSFVRAGRSAVRLTAQAIGGQTP